MLFPEAFILSNYESRSIKMDVKRNGSAATVSHRRRKSVASVLVASFSLIASLS
jgi:hypothetical protein